MCDCCSYGTSTDDVLSGFKAVEAIFQVIEQQSNPSFDLDGNVLSFYNIVCHVSFQMRCLLTLKFQSGPNQQYMRNNGRGPPKRRIGLVGTTYRPSGMASITVSACTESDS